MLFSVFTAMLIGIAFQLGVEKPLLTKLRKKLLPTISPNNTRNYRLAGDEPAGSRFGPYRRVSFKAADRFNLPQKKSITSGFSFTPWSRPASRGTGPVRLARLDRQCRIPR
jgi:hypothetical protein